MNTGIILVISILCFIVGFILNEVLRSRKEDKEKIPFKE